MATKRMLIDATHAEETRVVVLTGNQLEDFDVEVESRRQLKGNIYLAKVTRVEPSLQAAFVDYGGNRHGFLAFSEIHPDYFQIPVADREALVAEHDAAEKADEAARNEDGNGDESGVETVGGGDVEQEIRRPLPSHRNYKIQEVIKRRQILLIQVVKEERGTKGAALTTYLSLAGRYCVLMPNTARGGGISRKIANGSDRKRLKGILGDLDIAETMAVIVRTAGAERSKAEIKRDYEYLIRLWDQVRNMTLESTAPSLVYEEGNLIKRSIRDLYARDIDEIVVAGDNGYRVAKDFMKLLIPSHAKKVQPYKDEGIPLLQRYQVEAQLDGMHSPQVQLKSGGYIVINPTEALVSIDVNSGRATRERNIEETALRTNLEAAEEIARQLRLRDLAGLIVIDFIDMEHTRNQIKVERCLKDNMRVDRARIQLGRISPFGLLEMSRQRLRPSLIETSSEPCPYCDGTGIRRSTDTAALNVIRAIEEEGIRRRASEILVHVHTDVALYILNQKRDTLADIEQRYELSVQLTNDDSLIPPDHRIERVRTNGARDGAVPADEEADAQEASAEKEEGGKRKRRRRSRRKKRGEEDRDTQTEAVETAGEDEEPADDNAVASAESQNAEAEAGPEDEEGEPVKKRRRGKRGGRRRSRKTSTEETETTDTPEAEAAEPHPGDEGNETGGMEAPPAEADFADVEPMGVEITEAEDDSTPPPTPTESADEGIVDGAGEDHDHALPQADEGTGDQEPEPEAAPVSDAREDTREDAGDNGGEKVETADGREWVYAPPSDRRKVTTVTSPRVLTRTGMPEKPAPGLV